MNRIEVQQGAAVRDPYREQLEVPVERVIVPTRSRLNLRQLLRDGPVVRVLAVRDFKEVIRTGTREKVGRNDPCPCGSGAKFKKCCLGKSSASPWRR